MAVGALPTLRRLAEQAALLITGGSMTSEYPSIVIRAKYHIVSQINYLLKIEQLELRAIGENNASVDAVIANYDIDTNGLSKVGTKTIIPLPIRPISLPHGVGVWSVVMEDANGKEGEFLYLPSGVRRNFLSTYPLFDKTKKFTSSVSKTFWGWYSQRSGMELMLNADYTGVSNTIHLQLLVVDVSKIDEDDVLPVPADMTNQIIEYARQQILAEKPTKDLTENQTKDA